MMNKGLITVFVLLLFSSSTVFALTNQLKAHPSPYLAMHGNDPVHWQEWGKAVLEKARQSNKPIFISSGYFSCHWCHVMHRESYSLDVIASLLNEHFIPVKIDRELRPALDDYLINFVQQTTGTAGWPLNVFLTPEGYPLIGLTYAPPSSFEEILNKVNSTWQNQSEKATRLAKNLADHQLNLHAASQLNTETPELNTFYPMLVSEALSVADEFEGGFGEQNRFPMAPQLLVLLEYLRKHDNDQLEAFLTITLDQMQNLGLRDHVNGGFYRYTVDPGWTEPHFEKMLYTQALLSEVYLKAAVILNRPDYLAVARDTLDFVIRDMKTDKGGFVSSYSAIDTQGIEGAGYLWKQAELVKLLNEQELQLANLYWNLSATSVFEAGVLAVVRQPLDEVASQMNIPEIQARRVLASLRAKLRSIHKQASMPIDDKVLTAWNALLLSALSNAAIQLDDDGYRLEAKKLRAFLIEHAWDGETLSRARDNNRQMGRAGLEDYAYLAKALYDYAKLSGSAEDRHLADHLLVKAWQYFYKANSWHTGNEGLLPGMIGQSAISDGALPAADALIMSLSLDDQNQAMSQKAITAGRFMLPALFEAAFLHASHNGWIEKLNSGED